MATNITIDLNKLLFNDELKNKFLEFGREYFGEEFAEDPSKIYWEQKMGAKRIINEVFTNGALDDEKIVKPDVICIYTNNSEVYVCASYRCPHVLCPISLTEDGQARIGAAIGVTLQGATAEIEQQWNRECNWNWINGHQSIHFIFRDEWEKEHAKELDFDQRHS